MDNLKSLFPDLKSRIIPVLVMDNVDEALKMCELLCENGLPVAEFTFRTPEAKELITRAVEHFPNMLIGAGTLLNVTDLERARNAGAKFGVAPGFNPHVVQTAITRNFPFAPGICSPSELEQAAALGCRIFKFFPAEAVGGISYLQAIIAPYRHLGIQFIPTGGLTPSNAKEYLKIPEVITIGGTWLGKDIPDWKKVASAIRQAVEAVKEVQK
jgi:2-dehydro-3-deoxyphosphogluconate aldolase/(4S)-4-hydroxy-2-oxoglutarate aldolase